MLPYRVTVYSNIHHIVKYNTVTITYHHLQLFFFQLCQTLIFRQINNDNVKESISFRLFSVVMSDIQNRKIQTDSNFW